MTNYTTNYIPVYNCVSKKLQLLFFIR